MNNGQVVDDATIEAENTDVSATDALEEFESARMELFTLNGITEEQVATWKSQYGDVGWTSFIIPGYDYAVVFVYRSITRLEWKQAVKPMLAAIEDEDAAREQLCSQMLLHPPEATNPQFWDTAPALIPDTLDQLIMSVSGAEPQTAPMKL